MIVRLVTAVALACSVGAVRAETVWLSELDITRVPQGWGKALANQAVTGKPLAIAGLKCDRGVGMHANATMHIELSAGSTRFRSLVGIDDNAGDARASVRFVVGVDGKKVFDSGVMRWKQQAQSVDVDLRGARVLTLVCSDCGDGVNFDHADWGYARFDVSGGRPALGRAPHEDAEILPWRRFRLKEFEELRINGPRVFGVRPGHPVLFTIPATGVRPMRFSVDRLPAGLRVDSETGRLIGAVAKPGAYKMVVRAENAHGRTSRDFTLKVGDQLALTPPMGWNSWYVWEGRVTDQVMRDAADAMVSTGLINHGWSYVNIDDCWMVAPDSGDPDIGGKPRDANGDLVPNKRFPDMRAMTDYIHWRGLKVGTYISPGPRTCAGFEGSWQHEAQDARQFARWGFDFLKYDWCSYGSVAGGSTLDHLKKPYKVMWEELKKQDRDIVFNLCQYGMGNVWEWGAEVGHCWRTAGDLGAGFDAIPGAVYSIGFGQNGLEKHAGPGQWNDPDYLLLGYLSNWRGGMAPTPLSPNEQRTHMTLWCMLASPLFLSGDITRLDEYTLSLLTNDEVLEVNQDPLGIQARRMSIDGDGEVWAKRMEDGSLAVGLFNRGEFGQTVTARWSDLGIAGSRAVRDSWRQQDLGSFRGSYSADLPRHGCMLLRLRR